MGEIVRGLVVFVAIYFVVLFLIPKRWLPEDGTRAEWKALVGVGIVTILVMLRPELVGLLVLIWLGDFAWQRWHTSRKGP
jgi:hypothetical protein